MKFFSLETCRKLAKIGCEPLTEHRWHYSVLYEEWRLYSTNVLEHPQKTTPAFCLYDFIGGDGYAALNLKTLLPKKVCADCLAMDVQKIHCFKNARGIHSAQIDPFDAFYNQVKYIAKGYVNWKSNVELIEHILRVNHE
jgi:hypothetical protein